MKKNAVIIILIVASIFLQARNVILKSKARDVGLWYEEQLWAYRLMTDSNYPVGFNVELGDHFRYQRDKAEEQ